jgi:phosphoribosyl-dephospho-CoA transferase
MSDELALSRHDLVWLDPGSADEVRVADPAWRPEVLAWLDLAHPAVVRRPDPPVPPGQVALGIALPARLGRRRIALSAPPGAVARVARPLPLAEAIPSGPAAWSGPLRELEREARAAQLLLRVYGSLSWQHLTGERYLHEGSDLDLLVEGVSFADRSRALALLAPWAGHRTPRLDGELLLGGGRAAAWRELLAGPARVLVKSSSSVALEPSPPRAAGGSR